MKKIMGRKWIKHWVGHWKLLNNSYLGFQYTKLLRKSLGYDLGIALFISHKGYTVCYLDLTHYKNFGAFLAKKLVTNQKQVKYWSRQLIKQTDNILGLIRKLKKKKQVSIADYQKFVKSFYDYGVPHRVIKIVVDALAPKKLQAFLPQLQKARVYSEPVYAETEAFMEFVAGQIAKKIGYNKEHILYVTKDEFDEFFKSGKFLPKEKLAERYRACALFYEKGNHELITGKRSDRLEKIIEMPSKSGNSLSGFTAYPGKVKGRVKIIFRPEKVRDFKAGEILVTGMTRPEYLPLIKKSGAFVTDAGGMLSHAAITARELKKPCIVGTLIATKVLKNGDLVEVDATKGLIKIVSKS